MSWTPPTFADFPLAGVKVAAALAHFSDAPSTSTAVEQVLLQADPANTKNVLVGNSAAQPIVLEPGSGITVPIDRLSSIYYKSADGSNQNLNYLAV